MSGDTERCHLDESRLDPVRFCMTNFLDPAPPDQEWPNTSLSIMAVAYTCGAIRRRGEPVEHHHDREEWSLCRRLSDEAAKVMGGVEVGMGSSREAYFSPFYMVAAERAEVPEVLSVDLIRSAFGGTISPNALISIEPLEERGEWWTKVREYLVDNDDALQDPECMAEGKNEMNRWKAMVRWFRKQNELHEPSFVMVGRPDRANLGWCCIDFPYLAIGVTKSGSFVGIWGHYVDH
jgi:hypothetical protein